ncbi:MAG: hypothetical protein J1G38_04520 [Clostridiales bacterium]|nr:hypothetical protein [Clostridiales bacterium]
MNKTKSVKIIVRQALLCVLLFVLPLFALVPSVRAYAADEAPSGVLEDLKKDPSFDIVNYPARDNDYSISIIQIAEGNKGSLYVYAYQPSGDFKAEEIRMSTSASEDTAKYLDYELTLVSKDEPFYKYAVKGFKVASAGTRFYSIVQITRPWIKSVDGEPVVDNGNTIDNKVYAVGQTWIAETSGKSVIYSVMSLNTITVTEKYVGVLRYHTDEGIVSGSNTSLFYIAFNTDVFIERLLEATIKYDVVVVEYGTDHVLDTWYKNQIKIITADDVTSVVEGSWWKGYKKHKFSAIQTSGEFIKSITDSGDKLDKTVKKEIESKSWVVRFYTKKLSYGVESGGAVSKPGTGVLAPSKTSILQLTYETDGVSYKVGVVDDKRTASSRRDNISIDDDSWPWWVWVLIVFGAAIVLPILIALFPFIGQFLLVVLKALGFVLLWLLKALFWLISLPFKGIIALVRKIKEKKEEGANSA